MKKIYSILAVFLLCLFSLNSYAQIFTAKAGLNLSNMEFRYGTERQKEWDMKPGFHLGVSAAWKVNDLFSIEPAILFDTKGSNYESSYGNSINTYSYSLQYLDIPVNLKASKKVRDGINVYISSGPYVGLGLRGKTKGAITSPDYNNREKEEVTWGSDPEDDLRRLELGATFGSGIEINAFQLGVTYDLGLSNIISQSYSITTKNRVLRFSVGWIFGKK